MEKATLLLLPCVLSTAELSLMKNWTRLEKAEQDMRKKWWCGKLVTLVSRQIKKQHR